MITQIDSAECPWELLLLADPCRQMVESYLPQSVVLASSHTSRIEGIVVITPLTCSSWEIKNLAVYPSYQGQGIGKSLLLAALDVCRFRGVSEVWIGTGNSSLDQLGLYQKTGFRMVEIVRDFFVRHYADEIVENGIPCRDMVRLVATLTDHSLEHPCRRGPTLFWEEHRHGKAKLP